MSDNIKDSVRRWLETVVIDLNLCPFAKRELIKNRIRFTVTEANNEALLLESLQTELELLNDSADIETTLLIHPHVLQDFYDYNDFLNLADECLVIMQLDGIYQIASFHPDYQFSDTAVDDVENYSNRSPYPMLHILREDSLEQAITSHPDTLQIPEDNIARLQALGLPKIQALLNSCLPSKRES